MKQNNKNELMAAVATLIIAVAALLVLVFSNLHCQWPPAEADLAQQLQQDSIMFGGEYVMLGNTLEPTESQEMDTESPAEAAEEPTEQPEAPGEDMENAGKPAPKQAEPITQKQPSPMKAKVKPTEKKTEKTGPATAARPDKKVEQNRNGKTASAVASSVKNAFGRSKGNGSGKQGAPNGNASQGALQGNPGLSGLDGYTVASWGRPHSRWEGTVQVRVRVNARGKVIEARAVGGSGQAYAHPEVRRSCEQESLKSAFSVKKSRTTEGIGIITWRFI